MTNDVDKIDLDQANRLLALQCNEAQDYCVGIGIASEGEHFLPRLKYYHKEQQRLIKEQETKIQELEKLLEEIMHDDTEKEVRIKELEDLGRERAKDVADYRDQVADLNQEIVSYRRTLEDVKKHLADLINQQGAICGTVKLHKVIEMKLADDVEDNEVF